MKNTHATLFAIAFLATIPNLSFSVDEVEPNDSEATANYVEGSFTITGDLDEGTTNFDYFLIDDVSDYPFLLEAEARITSGPSAGSEAFVFEFIGEGQGWSENSSPTGTGSRSLSTSPPAFNQPFALLGPLYLRIRFASAAPMGTYEITYRLIPADKSHPLIRFFDYDKLRGNRFRIDINIDAGGRNFMGTALVRATANRTVRRSAPIADTTDPNATFPSRTFNTDGIKIDYTFRLKRPVTRLLIRAENRAGLASIRTKRYVLPRSKRKRSRNPRLNILP